MILMSKNSYIIESYQVGGSLKVTAIDPVTALEATVIVPTNTTKDDAQQLAVRKLEYVLKKQSEIT
jgi:hypothetical protein